MKKLLGGGIAAAALICASGANAENFTYQITWGDVEFVGGIGEDGRWGRGGSVAGTYQTTFEDGRTANGTISCVGMDQAPSATMFAVMLACDATSADGSSTTTIAYGCNYIGEPGPDSALGCVAGIRNASGEDGAVRRGAATMHWHSDSEANGTGQWYN